MDDIKELNLKPEVQKYLQQLEFTELTPIQKKVIPLALKGRDIIGISDTGTGKTHAYLLPIFNQIKVSEDKIQAVIIAPTRELARQIYEFAKEYEKVEPKIRIYLSSSEINLDHAKNLTVQPHLVIGTPGRLRDEFLKANRLRLDSTDILVIDEADMTMEFGFAKEIDEIVVHLKTKLQIMAFSATMPQVLKVFLNKYLHNPATIIIKNDENYFANVKHCLIPAKHHTYIETLLRILPGFNPYLCLIFANTRELASETAKAMRERGYKVTEIHGDLTTRQRKNAMKAITNDQTPYIVATDIAARGIDIPGVSQVVSLGFPEAIEYYIHRAGRTGRIKHEGTCYAIYNEQDGPAIRELQKKGIKFEHTDYRGGSWHILKPYGYKRKRPMTQLDKDIKKIATKKPKKVTPGYKKKRAAAIDKLKRKHKREIIQASIRQQAHEKNRLKQREKYKKD